MTIDELIERLECGPESLEVQEFQYDKPYRDGEERTYFLTDGYSNLADDLDKDTGDLIALMYRLYRPLLECAKACEQMAAYTERGEGDHYEAVIRIEAAVAALRARKETADG